MLRDRALVVNNQSGAKNVPRLGLVVEGGGMRGIVSGAMLCALEDLGFQGCFDAVYGSSAGAVNAAYFVAGGCWRGLSIYHDYLTGPAFIDFRKLLRGRSFIDLDYLFHEVLDVIKPLDFNAVVKSRTELNVAITDVDNLTTRTVNQFESSRDLIETLYASTWMPIGSLGTATWRGARALDGDVLASHPLRLALADGCTHILCLSTRPVRPPEFRTITLTQRLGFFHLERMQRGLGAAFLVEVRRYWTERASMHDERSAPTGPPYILDLAPLPSARELRFYERDSDRLLSAAREAYGIAYCALTGTPVQSFVDGDLRVVPRLTVVGPEKDSSESASNRAITKGRAYEEISHRRSAARPG